MALLTKPNMQQVWASGGDIVEPSDLKKQQGWTVEVPPHQFENWIQNRQDEYLAHINQRGIPAWDGLTNYEAGGLSYVQGSDGKVYKSVAASGPSGVVSNPTTDGTDTYWTIAFADVGAFLTQTAGDARYTQRSNNLSDLTNVATARANLGAAPTVSPTFTGRVAALGGEFELGRVDGTAGAAFIDFHSGATLTDYDARIISPAGSGDGSSGGGNLQIFAKTIQLSPSSGGQATSPTPPASANNTQIATTEFVKTAINSQTGGIAGSFSNLKASSTGTSATVTVTADAICLKNASNGQVVLNSVAVAPSLSAGGVNGLDTGTSAINTWYSVWVIWNGSTTAGLLSLSETAPVMPAGYTHKARVGWVRTDATANKFPLSFIQAGRSVQYKPAAGSNLTALRVMVSGTAGNPTTPTFVSVAWAAFAPPTSAKVKMSLFSYVGGNTSAVLAPNANHYGVSASPVSAAPLSVSMGGTATDMAVTGELIPESANFFYASTGNPAGVVCLGWEDNL